MSSSLKTLLDMYPYFFDKSFTSNFYKSQSVNSERFDDVYQSLFTTLESFKINKRVLIWREQNVDFEYSVHFVVNFPNLNSVTLYKNDEVIYTKQYQTDEPNNHLSYTYNGTTLNEEVMLLSDEINTLDPEEETNTQQIIPTDTFKAIITTTDGYTITKGYPENDTTQENEYDHDESLDEIGALHNIPRKKYKIVDPILYHLTEPPYNNKLTEDDYHYMNRILEYITRYHTTPLPVLELWKLYGIESQMINREKYLLKVFDETKHPTDWTPKTWEHKDKFSDFDLDSTEYFFVRANTLHPSIGSDVILNFKFINSLGEQLTDNYTIKVFHGNEQINTDEHITSFKISSSLLNVAAENVFTIIAFKPNGEELSSKDVIVTVKGCNSADYYVNPVTGDDSNTGKSISSPFRSIQKATTTTTTTTRENQIINLNEGEYTITEPIIVPKSCTIIGCPRNETIPTINSNTNAFFKLSPGTVLTLKNIKLVNNNGDESLIDELNVTNSNPSSKTINIVNKKWRLK